MRGPETQPMIPPPNHHPPLGLWMIMGGDDDLPSGEPHARLPPILYKNKIKLENFTGMNLTHYL